VSLCVFIAPIQLYGALVYIRSEAKRESFNQKNLFDFAGNTGPFIQYTYARIQSIIRKANFDFSKNRNDNPSRKNY
jgi:arginyl-tRNA synthetase